MNKLHRVDQKSVIVWLLQRSSGARLLLLALLLAALLPAAVGPSMAAQAATVAHVPLAGSTSIWAGHQTGCSIDAQGNALCWGTDSFGPAASTGFLLPEPIAAISLRPNFRCTLNTAGGVKCMGANDKGQLGTGSFAAFGNAWMTPAGLSSGVAAIESGFNFSCALMTNNTVRCWGQNDSGQLGNGSTGMPDPSPKVVPGAVAIVGLSAGEDHVCALSAFEQVFCWGGNAFGQIGDGSTGGVRPNLTQVKGLSGAFALSAGGGFTCALAYPTTARCWGLNDRGQLGNNSQTGSDEHVQVSGLTMGVRKIVAGFAHACALRSNGTVWCWGRGDHGELGNGTSGFDTHSLVPVNVIGLAGPATQVAVAENTSCAQLETGGVQCWGGNEFGAVGDATYVERTVATTVLRRVNCYAVATSFVGQGTMPTLSPVLSPPCPAAHFLPGQVVTLAAHPAVGWRLKDWVFSAAPQGGSADQIVMPDFDLAVGAQYEQCFALSLSHVGEGANPVATPASTAGCVAGTYAAGQTITLTAAPAQGHTIAGWSGTSSNGSTLTTNSLVMPGAAAAVSVTYVPSNAPAKFVYLPTARRP